MRSPLDRHGGSPSLKFLRGALRDPADSAPARRWADRLRAGGLVREIAREEAFRRSLPLVERWTRDLGIRDSLPDDERLLLVAARLSAEACAKAVRAALVPLGESCRAEGVAPILLKGTALHGALYADPALRPVSDVDLWVPPRDLPALRRALTGAGFGPDPITAGRLAAFDATGGRESFLSDFVFRADRVSPGVAIPLEVKLDPVQAGLPLRAADRFAEGAIPSPAYPGFRVLAPAPMAVQQALHLARHDGSDLLWLAEVAISVRGSRARTLTAEALYGLVEADGLAGTLCEVLRAAERVFPGSVPAGFLKPTPTSGPTPGRLRVRAPSARPPSEAAATLALQAFHAAASRHPGAVLLSLARRIWPHPTYVAVRMGIPPGGRVTLAHRLRRLLSLLRVPT